MRKLHVCTLEGNVLGGNLVSAVPWIWLFFSILAFFFNMGHVPNSELSFHFSWQFLWSGRNADATCFVHPLPCWAFSRSVMLLVFPTKLFQVGKHQEAKSMGTCVWILVSGVLGPLFRKISLGLNFSISEIYIMIDTYRLHRVVLRIPWDNYKVVTTMLGT